MSIVGILMCMILVFAALPGSSRGEEVATATESKPSETTEAVNEAYLYKIGISGFGRGEWSRNFSQQDSGFAPNHGEGRFVYRLRPYLHWNPLSFLSLRLEAQGYGYTGGNHQEHNKFSLYQGYTDLKLPQTDAVSLRAGRQDFSYGSGFILANDPFNDGLSFDAVKLQLKPVPELSIDLVQGRYARAFSNDETGNLSAAYAAYELTGQSRVEAYFFRDTGSADHHPGETLYIWGGRLTTTAGPFLVELEPVYETGSMYNGTTGINDHISAYGGHADLSLEGDLQGLKTKIFASYAYGSGSSEAARGAGASREFRNPNNYSTFSENLSVVGDLSGIDVGDHHASGLQAYTISWCVDLLQELNVAAGAHYYLANAVEPGFSRQIGLEGDLAVTWNFTESASLAVGYGHLFTGAFFKDASQRRRGVDLGYLALQFDLASKAKTR